MGRNYKSTLDAKTLAASMNSSQTVMELDNIIGIPSYPFTFVIDPDSANEEIVTVTGLQAGTTVVVVRGQDGTSAVAHDAGVFVRHMITGRDLQEPQDHMDDTSGIHGVTGDVVGTTDTQTLTNKTLTAPVINGGSISSATLSSPTIGSFSNANHAHQAAASGGTLTSGSYYVGVDAAQTASYTLALTDAGKFVRMNVATANNLTVPTNATVAFPIGTVVNVMQIGAGQSTLTPAGGVTIRSENNKYKTKAQYAVVGLLKIATDEWVAFGNLSA